MICISTRVWLATFATLLVFRVAQAGTFTTSTFTGDANVGISTANTYTHAYDLTGSSGAGNTTINGVVFTAVAGTNPAVANSFGTVNVGSQFGSTSTSATGSIGTLLSNFAYGSGTGVETHTLYGLNPGTTYTTRFYSDAFGSAGTRVQTVSSNGDSLAGFDGNAGVQSLNYTFVATGHSNAITFSPNNAGNTYHQYGFSNQVAPSQLAANKVAIQDLFNTGTNNSGAPVANGSADPHFKFVSGPQASGAGGSAEVQLNNGGWSGNDSQSSWIGVTASGGDNVAVGTYTYSTTFTIPSGARQTTASLSGNWWADNDGAGLKILLNGVDIGVGTSAPFNSGTGTTFSIIEGMGGAHFASGLNTLTFVVPNGGGSANPAGLRIAGLQGTVSTPEPASIALWSLLGLAGGGFAWRMRRKTKVA